jgi:hypothetical protein
MSGMQDAQQQQDNNGQESTQQENVPMKDQMLVEAESKTKELMNHIKAAMQLWSVQNAGKAPGIEDIAGMIKPKEEEFDPSEPRILGFKVYFGKKSENPVFYFDPSTNGYFDVNNKNWMQDRPQMCDHLNERDMGTNDVFDTILHGVMDDEDYSSLEKMNLIDDRSKQLWKKLNFMQEQTNAMMKSMETEGADEANAKPAKSDMPQPAEGESSSGSNPYQQIKSACNVGEVSNDTNVGGETGEDVFAQIKTGCEGKGEEGSEGSSSGVNYGILRQMIREEIAAALGQTKPDVAKDEVIVDNGEPKTEPTNTEQPK